MSTLRIAIAIATFGAVGALTRFCVTSICYRWFGRGFPLGTLTVNVIGCFLLGLLVFLLNTGSVSEAWRMPLTIGFLGSLTTFSTFGYDTFALLETGKWTPALANVSCNLLLGLLAVWAGGIFARWIVADG